VRLLGRRLLASASLGAAALGVATLATWDRTVLVFAGIVGIGAVALGRRSVLSQVLGRGVAWVVLAPMLAGLAESLSHGRLPDAMTVFLGATSAGALLLARPALHTPEAQAEFAPMRYRRLFLAGAVASATGATSVATFAVEALRWGEMRPGLALGALAVALAGSAVGVVRMRAWGVLLAMGTSVVTLGAALLSGNELLALGLALAAIPGALLASPLLAARLSRGTGAAPRLSSVVNLEEAPPAVRARVATLDEAEPDGEERADPARSWVGPR
jgi:hypothetical protein